MQEVEKRGGMDLSRLRDLEIKTGYDGVQDTKEEGKFLVLF